MKWGWTTPMLIDEDGYAGWDGRVRSAGDGTRDARL
jgi:hypothetical protein